MQYCNGTQTPESVTRLRHKVYIMPSNTSIENTFVDRDDEKEPSQTNTQEKDENKNNSKNVKTFSSEKNTNKKVNVKSL